MSNALIILILASVTIGTFLLCFAIEFIGDGMEPDDFIIDWPKALIGTALIGLAAVTAAVRWPV